MSVVQSHRGALARINVFVKSWFSSNRGFHKTLFFKIRFKRFLARVSTVKWVAYIDSGSSSGVLAVFGLLCCVDARQTFGVQVISLKIPGDVLTDAIVGGKNSGKTNKKDRL